MLLFQSQSSQKVGEARVFAQPVELGPHLEIDELQRALPIGFFQPLERAVVVAETDVNKRYMKRRRRYRCGRVLQLLQDLVRFIVFSSRRIRMTETREIHWCTF